MPKPISGAWLSLVERSVRDREVVGSNPIAPTFRINHLRASRDARFAFAVTFAATLGLEELRARSGAIKAMAAFDWRPISAVDRRGPGDARGKARARKILQGFAARQ